MSHHAPHKLSWLCPTPSHRERFLDMQSRLHKARAITAIGALALTLAVAHEGGTAILVLGLATMLITSGGVYGLQGRARPELWVFVTTVLTIQATVSIAAVLTGGPRSALPAALALPVVMVAARFSNRGIAVGAPISVVLLFAVTFGVDPGYVLDHPQSVAVPLTLIVAAAAYLGPLVASDVRHRADSTLDALTGLLNRRALPSRFEEVAQQAALAGQPVSVVLADIDHFKQVNDGFGHAAGDAVLRDVADALRSNLRTFELLYRIGGEEFLLLLPGADAASATALAEALRGAVADARPGGFELTCSFGIATAEGAIALEPLLAAADSALYAAKRGGRDQVARAAELV